MSKINWENDYEGLTRENLDKLYSSYLREGFIYIPFGKLHLSSSKIRTPSGRELCQNDIETILNNKLIFGDKTQLELLKSAEFFKICFARRL